MGITSETSSLFERLSTYYLNNRYPEFRARLSASIGKEEPNAFPTSELYNDNPFVKEILRTGEEISW
ncbi:hypothetical protein AGMMS4952_11800 [Spirochaetia bacterium]|nr:hypothetical protein AGMMS4952_11800 [Spirochaetia bacterium]